MSGKKKILIFIDWFLPGYKAGGPIRSVANLTDNLHNFFDFKIICSDKDYLETEPYENIEKNKWVNFESKADVYYFSEKQLTKENLSKLINETKFDIAYINGIYSYYYSILPLRVLKKSNKTIIIAARGMLSRQAFSSKQFKKRLFLSLAKLSGLYKNVRFQATGQKEKDDIKKRISRSANIRIVPNLTKSLKNTVLENKQKQAGILKLVSIARISAEKNILFALEILSLTKYSGEIEFDLYGTVYNETYWQSCKTIINQLPSNIKINYNNSIESNKVFETFSNYHFSFMPSIGENFGHSIFEAFSAGCPVIISDQTPWRNLEEKNIGWDISLNNKDKFHTVIQKCIDMSQEEYDKMSKNAFNFAVDYSANNDVIEQTKKLFE